MRVKNNSEVIPTVAMHSVQATSNPMNTSYFFSIIINLRQETILTAVTKAKKVNIGSTPHYWA